MRIDVLTLFPRLFEAPFSSGIPRRAIDQGLVSIHVHNIRDFAHDRHKVVDDYPYGGGAGMVLKPEPTFEAVDAVRAEVPETDAAGTPVVLLTPQGRLFRQQIARELSRQSHLILICGHYEGVDHRVNEHLATDEISIGDYVLTGGELPALVVMDAVIRLLPGVLGSEESALKDSHARGLLQYPQYTRPADYRGWQVPEVLLSGDHARIAEWRREQALLRTLERRPDLLGSAELDEKERALLERIISRTKGFHIDLHKEPVR